jgi:hypothetical protein
MKKTLSVLVVLMVVSSVVFARRSNNPDASPNAAVVKIGTTFKLYYKGSQSEDVKVAILDESRRIVFSEIIRNVDGFVRPYNFSSLPEGDYTIQITDKEGRQVEKISNRQVKGEALAHLLKVSGSEAKYLLTVSNKNSNEVIVKIYDSADNIIYNKREAASRDFARIYNLEGIGGEFTFEVTDGNGTSKSLRR